MIKTITGFFYPIYNVV